MATRKNIKKRRGHNSERFLAEFCQFAFVAIFAVLLSGIILWWLSHLIGMSPEPEIVITLYSLLCVDYLAYCAYKMKLKKSLNDNKLGIDSRGNTFRLDAEDSDEQPED